VHDRPEKNAFRLLLRAGCVAAWALAVAQITLTSAGMPWGGGADDATLQVCLLCGSRGAGDAVLNTVLFLPLGLLLGLRWRPWVALVAGLALSSCIEVLQLSIHGRHSTVGDIVWNGLGAGLGAVAAIRIRRWLSPGARRRSAVPVAVGLPVVYLLLAGWAIAPTGTDARYFGQWTPDLSFMPRYQGTLLEAELDGVPIPRGAPYPDEQDPRAGFAADWDVRARVLVGPAPASVSPVVSIYDEDRQEIFLLGIHGTDLVLRERRAGDAVGLDRLDLRWRGALAGVAQGDTVVLGARRVGGDRCLALDGEALCGLGVTPGSTWGLLLFLEGTGPLERTVLGMAWMGTLWLLVGLLGGEARSVARATGAGALLMLLVTGITPLSAPVPLEWLGMLLGACAGVALRPLARLFLGPAGPPGHREALRSG
jgi:hypothetical protein